MANVTERPEIGNELLEAAKAAVASAGAEWLGIRGESVEFRDPESGAVLSLYVFAATAENARLAIKSARERVREFTPWERAS